MCASVKYFFLTIYNIVLEKYSDFFCLCVNAAFIEDEFITVVYRNWVFATNLIPLSFQPNVVDLRYFKVSFLFDQII